MREYTETRVMGKRDLLICLFAIMMAFVVGFSASSAEFTVYDNRTDYETALGGVSIETQDFEGFPSGTNLDGVEFLPGIYVTSNMKNIESWCCYKIFAYDGNTRSSDRIYDAAGHLVRTLNLGHKPAGFYTTKEKAAYWNGRNQAGEPVTSGIYFYTIQAGEFTATRKMAVKR